MATEVADQSSLELVRLVAQGRSMVREAILDTAKRRLEAADGYPLRREELAEGYSYMAAPNVIGNKVLLGISGGDFGIRGFIEAHDVDTGQPAWRLWTIPGPGSPATRHGPATAGRQAAAPAEC